MTSSGSSERLTFNKRSKTLLANKMRNKLWQENINMIVRTKTGAWSLLNWFGGLPFSSLVWLTHPNKTSTHPQIVLKSIHSSKNPNLGWAHFLCTRLLNHFNFSYCVVARFRTAAFFRWKFDIYQGQFKHSLLLIWESIRHCVQKSWLYFI